MKILVTGAAGQLGSYLVEHLSNEHEVTGLDLKEPGIKMDNFIKGDIKEYRHGMDSCKGKDAVIHTAAQVSVDRSVSDPIMDAKDNILGTINMLEAATKTMTKQFIYTSSAAIFGNPVKIPLDEEHPTRPLSPYGVSKLAGENYTFAFQESYGLKATSIRPFNIFSPRQDPQSPYSGVITKFVERAREKKPLIVHGDGSQTRDFVHASDVIKMVELCLENEKAYGQAFNCGTGKAISVSELAEIINELTGNKAGVEHGE
ncbi:MAG: NAD-dependent epimerase/dehydratase family protein, partial [Thermoplasmata archaeon]|nr:NAD-dependent epimerase/dehydratase family protein [Thermoplasmata archaeon]